MAVALCADETGVVRTADITELLGTTTPQLSRVRKALIDRGLIESPGTGMLRFTMPGFAAYVLAQADAPRLGPLPSALRAALDAARRSGSGEQRVPLRAALESGDVLEVRG